MRSFMKDRDGKDLFSPREREAREKAPDKRFFQLTPPH